MHVPDPADWDVYFGGTGGDEGLYHIGIQIGMSLAQRDGINGLG